MSFHITPLPRKPDALPEHKRPTWFAPVRHAGLRCLTAMEGRMDTQRFSPSLKKSVPFASVVIFAVVVIIAAAILLLAAGRLA